MPLSWPASCAFSSSLGPNSWALAGRGASAKPMVRLKARTETPMRCVIMIDFRSWKQKGAREISHAPSFQIRMLRIRAAGDGGDAAAILRPAGFAGLGTDRTLLAIGDGFQTAGGDALAGQIFLHRIGAACAQRQIVFAGAAFVAVPFHGDTHRRVACQPGGLAAQNALVTVFDIVLVECELDGVADIDAEVLGAARQDGRGDGRGGGHG